MAVEGEESCLGRIEYCDQNEQKIFTAQLMTKMVLNEPATIKIY